MKIKIITPVGLYKEGEIDALHVCSVEGELTLLPHHMPMVAMLTTCKLQLQENHEYQDFAIAGGLLHMVNDQINILTDSIEGKTEIDLERAKNAKQRAEERLKKQDSNTNIKRAEVALEKAMNRIHVVGE